VDYYDCRQDIGIAWGLDPLWAALRYIIKETFAQDVAIPKYIQSNLFQLIREQPVDTTAHPHHDVKLNDDTRTTTAAFNLLVYLNTDEESRGGTAFYRHLATGRESMPTDWSAAREFSHAHLNRREGEREEDCYWHPFRERWERFEMVPMKFNRLAIFPGTVFHGAWHEPGWFANYPRISQVYFSKSP
jgi:hypothetical protein